VAGLRAWLAGAALSYRRCDNGRLNASWCCGRGVVRKYVCGVVAAVALTGAQQAFAADALLATKAEPASAPSPDDWTGWYVGAHLGYAWGNSSFSGPVGLSGSLDLFQPFDAFKSTGSFFEGLQAGYDHMFANRVVIGAEADASFPSFQNNADISIGGSAAFASPAGVETYAETVRLSGSVRGRIGYAPGRWLMYATSGFAWSYNQLTLSSLATGTADMPFLWRLGWAAGAGFEVPVAPRWTARLEYLYTDYGNESVLFGNAGQRFTSDFSLQELRAGLNYQFGANGSESKYAIPAAQDSDNVNFHGQFTFLWQGYPAFRSPYAGTNSLPGSGQGRETSDATLYAGIRLWQGAELWVNPEIDQGFGLANTLGVAGFPSGEAYKIGSAYPYARLPRAFIRQTIALGGDTQKVESGINQFAASETANRIVITVGKLAVTDIFDNNKYAHDPRNDFMNWTLIDTGTFDYAADAWGYSYGASVEWYRGAWTVRGGIFDLSTIPNSPDLDPTFDQFQWVGEIERRYELWGEPGKLAVTGFLTRGRMGNFDDAIALAEATGTPADITAVRRYQSRGGVSMNLEQQITPDIGAFLRAGWADGNQEPYEFSDIDRTVAGGVSISGKLWGRADDTVGIAGVINDISKIHQEFLDDGGLGILVGDGQLPHPGLEQIVETYYSYAISATTKLSFDYQLVVNPGYNEDRGPVNVFSGRVHWQF
jgi:high affinity Mn2+ porin